MIKPIYTTVFLLCCMASSYSQNEPKNGLTEKLDSIFRIHYGENHTQKQLKTAKKTVDSILTHASFSDRIAIQGNYDLQVPKIKMLFSEDKKVRIIKISPFNLPGLRLVQYSDNREELYRFSTYLSPLKLNGVARVLIDDIYHLSTDDYLFTVTNFDLWTSPVDTRAFVVNMASNKLNSNPDMLFKSAITVHFNHYGSKADTKPFFKIVYDEKNGLLTTPVHRNSKIKGVNLYKYNRKKRKFVFLTMKAAVQEKGSEH